MSEKSFGRKVVEKVAVNTAAATLGFVLLGPVGAGVAMMLCGDGE